MRSLHNKSIYIFIYIYIYLGKVALHKDKIYIGIFLEVPDEYFYWCATFNTMEIPECAEFLSATNFQSRDFFYKDLISVYRYNPYLNFRPLLGVTNIKAHLWLKMKIH